LGISVIELEFRTFVVVVQFLLRVPLRRRGLDDNGPENPTFTF
jgi:hypothetical protein